MTQTPDWMPDRWYRIRHTAPDLQNSLESVVRYLGPYQRDGHDDALLFTVIPVAGNLVIFPDWVISTELLDGTPEPYLARVYEDQATVSTSSARVSKFALHDLPASMLEDRVLAVAERYLQLSAGNSEFHHTIQRQVYIDLMVTLGHDYNAVLDDLATEGW